MLSHEIAVHVAGQALRALIEGESMPQAGSAALEAVLWAIDELTKRSGPEQQRQVGAIAIAALAEATSAALQGQRAALVAAQASTAVAQRNRKDPT